eukprot:gnl/MRDRNA2_/MRDRNA2_149584_c0_seq1.p1 gnl/MRDRNA2_/MRDRNA2_149584_c0~~gnl/MRDRNA2_/MRDRNA2_149584_c0_seq1.p1  ORF type:complete len:378 (+),score=77.91 gnl/MRDRNA2_/MRDRNA2_149584_c0_seq1:72-1205(+)
MRMLHMLLVLLSVLQLSSCVDKCLEYAGMDEDKCDRLEARGCVFDGEKGCYLSKSADALGDGCTTHHGENKTGCTADSECTWSDEKQICSEAMQDSCSARKNRYRCRQASKYCLWKDDEGCLERSGPEESEDGYVDDVCFKRIGMDKSKCTTDAVSKKCIWRDDRGCFKRPSRSDNDSDDDESEDGCFRQYGEKKGQCRKDHECAWHYEKKVCYEQKDGCFARFGMDKDKCTTGEASEYCVWKDEDGCYEKEDDDAYDGCSEYAAAACKRRLDKCIWDKEKGCLSKKEEAPVGYPAKGEADNKDNTFVFAIASSIILVLIILVGVIIYLWRRLQKVEAQQRNLVVQGSAGQTIGVVGMPVHTDEVAHDNEKTCPPGV